MKYSIITVSYNSAKTIEKTIRSILVQGEKDYEYIIIDGASSDNTVEIIKQYEPLFKGRLRWVSEKDKGIYNAMNKGISMAKGDVVGIVNSDDWLEDNTLEILNNEICSRNIDIHDAVIITGWMKFHYKDGGCQIIRRSYQQFVNGTKKYDMYMSHPPTWVSRTAYNRVGSFDESIRILADNDLMLRMYFANVTFVFIENVVTNMADGGISNHFSIVRLHDRKAIISKYVNNSAKRMYLLTPYIFKEFVKWILPLRLIRTIKNAK